MHYYGNYQPAYFNDTFSIDIDLADTTGINIYVATPLGTLRKYDPISDLDIILYNDIPFDPKHPGRQQ